MKWKQWLTERFLPAWCREELLAENRKMSRELVKIRAENRELRAYVDGLHTALRYQKRSIIPWEEKKR